MGPNWRPDSHEKRLVFAKVAKVANFFGSGFGDLAGQKLVSRQAWTANLSESRIGHLALILAILRTKSATLASRPGILESIDRRSFAAR